MERGLILGPGLSKDYFKKSTNRQKLFPSLDILHARLSHFRDTEAILQFHVYIFGPSKYAVGQKRVATSHLLVTLQHLIIRSNFKFLLFSHANIPGDILVVPIYNQRIHGYPVVLWPRCGPPLGKGTAETTKNICVVV